MPFAAHAEAADQLCGEERPAVDIDGVLYWLGSRLTSAPDGGKRPARILEAPAPSLEGLAGDASKRTPRQDRLSPHVGAASVAAAASSSPRERRARRGRGVQRHLERKPWELSSPGCPAALMCLCELFRLRDEVHVSYGHHPSTSDFKPSREPYHSDACPARVSRPSISLLCRLGQPCLPYLV